MKLERQNCVNPIRLFISTALLGLIAILMLFSLAGCGKALEEDLVDYVTVKMPELYAFEQKITKPFESVTGSNFQGDEKMYDVIKNEVLPAFEPFFAACKEVSPKSDEIREAHKLYVQAFEVKQTACQDILTLVDGGSKDEELNTKINRTLIRSDELMDEYFANLNAAAAKAKISIDAAEPEPEAEQQ